MTQYESYTDSELLSATLTQDTLTDLELELCLRLERAHYRILELEEAIGDDA